MKRIPIPVCIGCRLPAAWESGRWPSVRLCYQCIREIATWCVEQKVAIGNPFLLELATDVWPVIESRGITYQPVWYRSPEGHSNSQILIRIPAKNEDCS